MQLLIMIDRKIAGKWNSVPVVKKASHARLDPVAPPTNAVKNSTIADSQVVRLLRDATPSKKMTARAIETNRDNVVKT